MTRIMGTVREEQYTFLIISCSIHHKMRDVSDNIEILYNIENQNTFYVQYIFF